MVKVKSCKLYLVVVVVVVAVAISSCRSIVIV